MHHKVKSNNQQNTTSIYSISNCEMEPQQELSYEGSL